MKTNVGYCYVLESVYASLAGSRGLKQSKTSAYPLNWQHSHNQKISICKDFRRHIERTNQICVIFFLASEFTVLAFQRQSF